MPATAVNQAADRAGAHEGEDVAAVAVRRNAPADEVLDPTEAGDAVCRPGVGTIDRPLRAQQRTGNGVVAEAAVYHHGDRQGLVDLEEVVATQALQHDALDTDGRAAKGLQLAVDGEVDHQATVTGRVR